MVKNNCPNRDLIFLDAFSYIPNSRRKVLIIRNEVHDDKEVIKYTMIKSRYTSLSSAAFKPLVFPFIFNELYSSHNQGHAWTAVSGKLWELNIQNLLFLKPWNWWGTTLSGKLVREVSSCPLVHLPLSFLWSICAFTFSDVIR